MKVVRAVSKLSGSIKRIPGALLRLPQAIVRLLQRLWDLLVRAAKPLKVLPLDTFSGKTFAVFEVLGSITLICGAFYGLGRWQDITILRRLTNPLFFRLLLVTGVTLATFAVAYPLDRRGLIEATLVRLGIRQFNRKYAGIFAGAVGLFSGVLSAVLVANGATIPIPASKDFFIRPDWWTTVFVFALVFTATTGVSYWLIQRKTKSYTRYQLSVVELLEQDDDTTSAVIRNDSDQRVTLENAKIEDSLGEGYTVDRTIMLRPGEKQTLDLPPDFKLQTTEYEIPSGLDLLYDEKRNARIYARSGDLFVLEWDNTR